MSSSSDNDDDDDDDDDDNDGGELGALDAMMRTSKANVAARPLAIDDTFNAAATRQEAPTKKKRGASQCGKCMWGGADGLNGNWAQSDHVAGCPCFVGSGSGAGAGGSRFAVSAAASRKRKKSDEVARLNSRVGNLETENAALRRRLEHMGEDFARQNGAAVTPDVAFTF